MISSLISQINKYVGQEVQLQGWTYNFRSSGKIFFLQLRDGSARVQIVYSKADVSEETWTALESLRLESSVRVIGRVKEDTRAPSGFELDGLGLEIVSLATDEFPIGKKDHGPDFLLDERHLWLRSDKQWAIMRVRNQIINSTYAYFAENGFVKFDTPILTPTSCVFVSVWPVVSRGWDYVTRPRIRLWSCVSCRKIKDASSSHRVLDDGCGGSVC